MQQKLFILTVIFSFTLISCGKKAIEAEVGAKIPITAEVPDGNESYDYSWEFVSQPDGSLMQIDYLVNSDNPETLTFIPDAPGDYTIQVTITQYGDEVSVQSWDYTVSGEPIEISEITSQMDSTEPSEETWLNETIEDTPVVKEPEKVAPPPPPPIRKKPVTKKISKPKPPLPGSSIPVDREHFTIQVAAKKMRSNADEIAARFLNEGLDVYVQKAYFKETDEIWYRIRLGKFDDLENARQAAKEFANKYKMSTWVDYVRLDSK